MRYKEIWKVYSKVFDLQTLKNLEYLKKKGAIGENLTPILEGKESVVFKTYSDYGIAAVKIYKVMNVSFKNRVEYLKYDRRYKKFPRSRIGLTYLWVKKEWSNLNRLYNNLVRVPFPISIKGNILVMEFIGDEKPAPRLKDIIKIYSKDYIKEIVKKTIKEYRKIIHNARMVHADFSEYNVLVYKDNPVIMDVSQSMLLDDSVLEFLAKDIINLYRICRIVELCSDINDVIKMLEIDKLDTINKDALLRIINKFSQI